jgi:hypothetical protein
MAQIQCPNCGNLQQSKQGTATWKLLVIGGFGVFLLLMGLFPTIKLEYGLLGLGLLFIAYWYSRPQQIFQCSACGNKWDRTGKPVSAAAALQSGQSQHTDIQPRATAPQSTDSQRSTGERLTELDKLLADKIITEDEYKLKREEILREL